MVTSEKDESCVEEQLIFIVKKSLFNQFSVAVISGPISPRWNEWKMPGPILYNNIKQWSEVEYKNYHEKSPFPSCNFSCQNLI